MEFLNDMQVSGDIINHSGEILNKDISEFEGIIRPTGGHNLKKIDFHASYDGEFAFQIDNDHILFFNKYKCFITKFPEKTVICSSTNISSDYSDYKYYSVSYYRQMFLDTRKTNGIIRFCVFDNDKLYYINMDITLIGTDREEEIFSSCNSGWSRCELPYSPYSIQSLFIYKNKFCMFVRKDDHYYIYNNNDLDDYSLSGRKYETYIYDNHHSYPTNIIYAPVFFVYNGKLASFEYINRMRVLIYNYIQDEYAANTTIDCVQQNLKISNTILDEYCKYAMYDSKFYFVNRNDEKSIYSYDYINNEIKLFIKVKDTGYNGNVLYFYKVNDDFYVRLQDGLYKVVPEYEAIFNMKSGKIINCNNILSIDGNVRKIDDNNYEVMGRGDITVITTSPIRVE